MAYVGVAPSMKDTAGEMHAANKPPLSIRCLDQVRGAPAQMMHFSLLVLLAVWRERMPRLVVCW